jgi:prevent-host-death family protein
MRIASLADVKAKLSAYLQEAETGGPIVITRNGKAVAILLAPESDDDLERLLLSRSQSFQSLLEASRGSVRRGRGLSPTTFWKAASEGRGGRRRASSRGSSKKGSARSQSVKARRRDRLHV